MKVKATILATLAAIVLISCNPNMPVSAVVFNYEIQQNVYEFRTSSGRDCVYVSGGGLSCRW